MVLLASALAGSVMTVLMLPSPVGGPGGAGVVPYVDPARVTAHRAPVMGAVPVGKGVWPLDPRPTVTRGFDPPRSAYGRGHRGVDLLGRTGEPVHATLPGVVTFAAPLAGRGVVVVDHGFGRTTYEPVRASVSVGRHVGRGQVIGTLAAGGSHCAPRACLHWGLLRGPTYLDPLVLVGAVPVRLLPLTGSATGP